MHNNEPIVLDEAMCLIENNDAKQREYIANIVKQYLAKKRTKISSEAFDALVDEALKHHLAQNTKKGIAGSDE